MRPQLVLGLCLCLLTTSVAASAQSVTGGSIRGYVKDEQEAVLQGVTLSAVSADAPGPHVASSDDAGYYRLLDLPPGTYTIRADLDGFASWVRENVSVRAGLNLSVPIVMKLGGRQETVQVSAETPLLESRSAVQGTNISGDLARQLPLFARRHWTNVLAITPGVVTQTLAGEQTFYFVHGSTFDSQVALVDGADVNGASQSISLNVNLSTESLEDLQIRTGGVDASAPLGTGPVINAVTKSGTNELKGSATVLFQPDRWNDSNAAPGGTSQKPSITQGDLGLGGPLHHDRSWLFGSYRYNRIVEAIARTPQQVATLRSLVPTFEPFDRTNRSNFVFVKSTTQVTADHRAMASFRHDVNPADGGGATDAALFGRSLSGGSAVSTQLSSVWRRRWLSTINASYNTTANPSELLRSDMPSHPVSTSVILNGGRLASGGAIATLDNAAQWTEQANHKATITADVTVPLAKKRGEHEIRAGFFGQQLHVESVTHYANGGFATEELVLRNPSNPAAGLVPFHRQIFDADRATTRAIDTSNIAVYAQDSWRPTTRTTVTGGVRAELVEQRDRLFGLRAQDSLDFGPRIGVNYVLATKTESTVRVNWARRQDVLTFVSAGSNTIGSRDLYDVNLDGVFESVFPRAGATALSPDRQFDANRHQPYVDELIAAYAIHLPGSTTFEASVIDRRFRDAVTFVESNGIYENSIFKGYRNAPFIDTYLVTNDRWNYAVYQGIELSASKRTSRIEAVGSYTRQWRHLAGTWQPNDPASFIQPAAFANDKGLGRSLDSSSLSNSLSGISMAQNIGPASQWQDHVFSVAANAQLSARLSASVSYVFTSGPWSGPVVTLLSAADPRFGPATLPLPTGGLVTNPLSTRIRFAGDTRGDGQFALDPLQVLNAGVSWVVRVGRARTQASLRLLNALNGATDQLIQSGGNQVYSANYQLAGQRQPPRALQFTLGMSF